MVGRQVRFNARRVLKRRGCAYAGCERRKDESRVIVTSKYPFTAAEITDLRDGNPPRSDVGNSSGYNGQIHMYTRLRSMGARGIVGVARRIRTELRECCEREPGAAFQSRLLRGKCLAIRVIKTGEMVRGIGRRGSRGR